MTALEIAVNAFDRIYSATRLRDMRSIVIDARKDIAAIATQQQAAPRATIDGEEFTDLLRSYVFAQQDGNSYSREERAALIAHIGAFGNQRYFDGLLVADTSIAAAGMADKRDATDDQVAEAVRAYVAAGKRGCDLLAAMKCAIDAAMAHDQKGGA